MKLLLPAALSSSSSPLLLLLLVRLLLAAVGAGATVAAAGTPAAPDGLSDEFVQNSLYDETHEVIWTEEEEEEQDGGETSSVFVRLPLEGIPYYSGSEKTNANVDVVDVPTFLLLNVSTSHDVLYVNGIPIDPLSEDGSLDVSASQYPQKEAYEVETGRSVLDLDERAFDLAYVVSRTKTPNEEGMSIRFDVLGVSSQNSEDGAPLLVLAESPNQHRLWIETRTGDGNHGDRRYIKDLVLEPRKTDLVNSTIHWSKAFQVEAAPIAFQKSNGEFDHSLSGDWGEVLPVAGYTILSALVALAVAWVAWKLVQWWVRIGRWRRDGARRIELDRLLAYTDDGEQRDAAGDLPYRDSLGDTDADVESDSARDATEGSNKPLPPKPLPPKPLPPTPTEGE